MIRNYLISNVSFTARDKFNRKCTEFVLYNSHSFKKLKRIEKIYTMSRLNKYRSKPQVIAKISESNYNTNTMIDCDSDGTVVDNPNESSPNINHKNNVNK